MKSTLNLAVLFTVFTLLCFEVTAQQVNPNGSSPSMLDCGEVLNDLGFASESLENGAFRYFKSSEHAKTPSFDFNLETPFSAYLRYTKELISVKNSHAERICNISSPVFDLMQKNQMGNIDSLKVELKVKDLISPFQLTHKGNKKAILLVHGLTDSPYHFHDLAYYFYQQGFDVRTMLIPGHATAPEGLTTVDFEQWREATAYVIGRTLLDYEDIYLGGFSTGGALIYDYLVNREYSAKRVRGLFMWAPASKAKSEMAWLAEYVNYLPFLTWLSKSPDLDFAKYESFPVNAAAQVNRLMSSINENADDTRFIYHNIPAFWVASEADATINTESTLVLAAKWHNPELRSKTAHDVFLYYGDTKHAKSKLPESFSVISPRCLIGEECHGLLDIAHTAMINAPSNPHYGNAGNYRSCEHHAANQDHYSVCKKSERVDKGEITAENLESHSPMIRLTHNPHFEHMTNAISQFLQSIED